MCTMDYPKFTVSNQKEDSISVQRVKLNTQFNLLSPYTLVALWIVYTCL